MPKDQYTAEQVAVVLLQAAISLEYYMQEEFNLYDVGPGSRSPAVPTWVKHGYRLSEWCQERVYELGLGVWEQETFTDELMLDDFRPVVQQVASAAGPGRGKVAFLALTTALVLEAFAEVVGGEGKERADELRGAVNAYLRKAWGVDLARGTVSPQLADVHLPLAREAARRWRRRLEALSHARR